VSYTKGERNQNVLGVAKEWRYHLSGDAIAQPTLTFSADTGAIFGADVEINGTVKWFFTDGTPAEDVSDLQAVLTHEVGHLLGFAHSDDPSSVMYPHYAPGDVRHRTLSNDEIEAVCTVYPNGE